MATMSADIQPVILEIIVFVAWNCAFIKSINDIFTEKNHFVYLYTFGNKIGFIVS